MKEITPTSTRKVNLHLKHFDNHFELIETSIIASAEKLVKNYVLGTKHKKDTYYDYTIEAFVKTNIGLIEQYEVIVKRHKIPQPPPKPITINIPNIMGSVTFNPNGMGTICSGSAFAVSDSHIRAGTISITRSDERISLYHYIFLVEYLD